METVDKVPGRRRASKPARGLCSCLTILPWLVFCAYTVPWGALIAGGEGFNNRGLFYVGHNIELDDNKIGRTLLFFDWSEAHRRENYDCVRGRGPSLRHRNINVVLRYPVRIGYGPIRSPAGMAHETDYQSIQREPQRVQRLLFPTLSGPSKAARAFVFSGLPSRHRELLFWPDCHIFIRSYTIPPTMACRTLAVVF